MDKKQLEAIIYDQNQKIEILERKVASHEKAIKLIHTALGILGEELFGIE